MPPRCLASPNWSKENSYFLKRSRSRCPRVDHEISWNRKTLGERVHRHNRTYDKIHCNITFVCG
jgi:hypothetical protein